MTETSYPDIFEISLQVSRRSLVMALESLVATSAMIAVLDERFPDFGKRYEIVRKAVEAESPQVRAVGEMLDSIDGMLQKVQDGPPE